MILCKLAICGQGHIAKWLPCPYKVKKSSNASSSESNGQQPCALVCSTVDERSTKFVQMMILGLG